MTDRTVLLNSGVGNDPLLPVIVPTYGDFLSVGQTLHLMENVLAWRGVILGPSDCGYCLWALPQRDSVEMIDAIRGDSRTALPLSVGGMADLRTFVEFHPIHLRVATATWPGGVTIVAKAIEKKGRAWSAAVRGGDNLGVRMSRSLTEYSMVSSCGTPLISAALRSPTGHLLTSFDDAYSFVLDRITDPRVPSRPIVAVRPDQDRFDFLRASTVMQFQSGMPTILREGDHDARAFAAMIRRVAPGEWGDAT